MKQPYTHQTQAAQYLVNGGSYLFMEPRTGKTLSALLAMEELLKEDEWALIIAPKSVLPVWRDELEERDHKAVIVEGTKKKKTKALQTQAHRIITYESSWRMIKDLDEYSLVIFDETLKLQNGDSAVGKHWRNLARDYPAIPKWGLSGAPCPEGALQLANQQMSLVGSWFNETMFETYRYKYWTWDEYRFKYKAKDPRHDKEAQARFKSKAFRVSQAELKMGDKVFEVRKVNATKAEEALLKANLALTDADGVKAAYAQAASSGIDAHIRKIVPSATKLQAVVDCVKDMLDEDPDTQIVVMHKYIVSGAWLADSLGCPRIYGDTDGESRDQIVKAYQSGAERVIVCQADAVKMGLDFSAGGSGVLIYAENSWSGDTFIQSTQRVVNIERKTPALILTFCLVYKDGYSVDERIYNAVRDKRNFNAKLLEEKYG